MGIAELVDPNGTTWFSRRRLATRAYHIECFLVDFPNVRLETLRGFERHGRAALMTLARPQSFWELLDEMADEP